MTNEKIDVFVDRAGFVRVIIGSYISPKLGIGAVERLMDLLQYNAGRALEQNIPGARVPPRQG